MPNGDENNKNNKGPTQEDLQNRQKSIDQQKLERDLLNETLATIKERAIVDKKRITELRNSVDIQQDISNSIQTSKNLKAEISKLDARANKDLINKLNKEKEIHEAKTKQLIKENEVAKSFEKNLGTANMLMGEMSKIPLVGSMLNTQKASEAMTEEFVKSKDKTKALAAGFKEMGKSLNAAMGPLILLTIIKSLVEANKSVVGIQKELGISRGRAKELRGELAATAMHAKDIVGSATALRITTKALLELNTKLNDQFQTAAVFNQETLAHLTDMNKAGILLDDQLGVAAGSAARMGMSVDQALEGIEGIVNESNAATGAQINLKNVIHDTHKISGQIRAQMGGNVMEISKAVVKAKALGFELEQIANAGKSLLDFESSINAELEAELLTGKQLNLERARLAALTGDYETLTAEIAANVGDFADFSKLNVLQQESIAKAVGMTADELSNALLLESDRAAMLAEAEANNDKQTIAMLKQMDAQEEFNAAVEQMKQLFVDMVGPIEGIVNRISGIAEFFGSATGKALLFTGAMVKLGAIVAGLFGKSLATAIASIYSGFGFLGIAGVALAAGAVVTLMASIGKAKATKVDDAIIDPQGGIVTQGPKGTIQLNKEDSIIAGTNLGGGGGGNESEKFDYKKMAMAMSNIKVSTNIKHDSFGASSSTGKDGDYQKTARYSTKFV